ncbi:unnamed protein product [Owenia fusiformis]|uniref:Uncharacterized protein n=1 Tax=Owenia fusiformis TaxID=6347 RepID=A0A8J1UWW6_OWEFU|nr:unnamed protein product [Owenia fusiformis]
MTPKRKKQCTYFTIGIFFLLGGIEYAVILPTIWLYLHNQFHAEQYFLGIVLSAFSFSGLFAGPIMGRWSDVAKNTKWILIFANMFEIGGNIMYFMGYSMWFILAARLIAGIGTGVGAAILADIARVTTPDERTGVLSMFMGIRQIALLFGPGFNLFLREFDFKIGPFEINKYTSPGLFMAGLWTILNILILFLYHELPPLKDALTKTEHTEDTTTNTAHTDTVGSTIPREISMQTNDLNDTVTNHVGFSPSDVMIESAENLMNKTKSTHDGNDKNPNSNPNERIANGIMSHTTDGATDISINAANNSNNAESVSNNIAADSNNVNLRTNSGNYGSIDNCDSLDNSSQYHQQRESGPNEEMTKSSSLPWRFYYDEFIREEIVVVLAIVFVGFFNQVAMETILTPLTQSLLNWGELENSLLYCCAGVEILFTFLLVRFMSKRLSDRTMLIFGFALQMGAVIFLLYFLPTAEPGNLSKNLPIVLVGLAADVFGLPFLIVCSTSLYSKITQAETQGFSQGLRRSVGGIATIMGPLWAGALLKHLYLMFGVMLGLMVLILGMMVLSYKTLDENRNSDSNKLSINYDNNSTEEQKPLLNNEDISAVNA